MFNTQQTSPSSLTFNRTVETSLSIVLTYCNVDLFDDGLQVLRQRSQLQLLDLDLVLLQRKRWVAMRFRVRVRVFSAFLGRCPVQLGQELLQVFKRVLPVHLSVKLLPSLFIIGVLKAVQALAAEVAADASGRLPLGFCVIGNVSLEFIYSLFKCIKFILLTGYY